MKKKFARDEKEQNVTQDKIPQTVKHVDKGVLRTVRSTHVSKNSEQSADRTRHWNIKWMLMAQMYIHSLEIGQSTYRKYMLLSVDINFLSLCKFSRHTVLS